MSDIKGKYYKYKNHAYRGFGTCTLKNPTTREWEDAYTYQHYESGLIFCREKYDFLDKFVPIDLLKGKLEKGELIVPTQKGKFLSGGIIEGGQDLDIVPVNITFDKIEFEKIKGDLEGKIYQSFGVEKDSVCCHKEPTEDKCRCYWCTV